MAHDLTHLSAGFRDDLAAHLMADHFAHTDASIVWLVRRPGRHASAGDGWRFEYANPGAMRLLGVSTLAALRAIPLPVQSSNAFEPLVSKALTPAELLRAARLVAEADGAVNDALTRALHPRFLVRQFEVPELAGVQLLGRHGDLIEQARRDLERTQRLMSTYFEHAGVEAFLKDLDGRYMLVNDNFRQAHAHVQTDLLGHTDFDIVDADQAARFRAQDRMVVEAGRALEFEGLGDGSGRVFRIVKFPVHDESGEMLGVGGVATDVSEALLSRAALSLSEEQFRLAFLHANEGMATLALNGTIQRINDRMCEMLGRTPEELVGRKIYDFHHAYNEMPFETSQALALRSGSATFPKTMAKPDGTPVHLGVSVAVVNDAAGEPSHFVVLCVDESERRAVEARARQTEKLEAVGHIAGGIAHDINNLLGGILGYAELVRGEVADPRVVEQIDHVINAALRASDYTSRLLSLARPPDQAVESFDVHEIVVDVVQMIRSSVDPAIEFVVALDSACSTMLGNPHQMHGALLNLGLNARDAITGAGTIAFGTQLVPDDDGVKLRLTVRDTGAGIAPHVLPRLFDPFFTTKPEGRGTGLGLTTVLAVVNQHHGTVAVDSTPGRGSTFTLEFPIGDRDDMATEIRHPGELAAGTRVLVVDDDEVVRYVVAESLRLSGCVVGEAVDGADAIAVLERADKEGTMPAVVLFDLRMPRLGGAELFSVLRQRWPRLSTVLMTGFSGDEAAEELRQRGLGGVIEKPFQRGELLAALADALTP